MQNHSLCFFSLNLDNCFYHKEICDNIQNQLFVSDENYCNCEEFQCRTELVDDPDSIECCILEAREARTINQNSNKIEYVNKVSGMAMVIGSITVNSNFDDEYMIILTPPPYVNLYFMSKPWNNNISPELKVGILTIMNSSEDSDSSLTIWIHKNPQLFNEDGEEMSLDCWDMNSPSLNENISMDCTRTYDSLEMTQFLPDGFSTSPNLLNSSGLDSSDILPTSPNVLNSSGLDFSDIDESNSVHFEDSYDYHSSINNGAAVADNRFQPLLNQERFSWENDLTLKMLNQFIETGGDVQNVYLNLCRIDSELSNNKAFSSITIKTKIHNLLGSYRRKNETIKNNEIKELMPVS